MRPRRIRLRPQSAASPGATAAGSVEGAGGSRGRASGRSWWAWMSGTSLEDRAAVALGLVLLVLFALVNEQVPVETSHGFDLLAGGLLVLATALLFAGRRFPATVALLELGISVAWYSRYTNRLIDIPTLTAFYMLGLTGDRRRELGVAGLTAAFLILGVASSPSEAGMEIAIEGLGWTAAAILCGELVRSRRLLLGQYAERAARAEAERDAEAERRVTSERLRIARDLHDVLAHTVSLMTVQAGVAADSLDRDPGAARTALVTLRSAGKEAMAEVRATVAVLRGADAGAGAETAPAPGLDRVPELVDAARAQGLDVQLTMDVGDVEVDGLVALTAYRVVQESLTNVTRHADASQAAVRILGAPAGLVVEVVDNGRAVAHVPLPTSPSPQAAAPTTGPGPPESPESPAAPPGGGGTTATTSPPSGSRPAGPSPGAGAAGFGLRGMGERVEAVGGQLSYGPVPGRGWAVRAVLPVRGSREGRE